MMLTKEGRWRRSRQPAPGGGEEDSGALRVGGNRTVESERGRGCGVIWSNGSLEWIGEKGEWVRELAWVWRAVTSATAAAVWVS
jgi:hypothetical protein